MERTRQQLLDLERAVAALQAISQLDNVESTENINTQRQSLINNLRNDILPNLIVHDQNPMFLFTLKDIRDLFSERYFIDIPATLDAYLASMPTTAKSVLLTIPQQRAFYEDMLAFYNGQQSTATQRFSDIASMVDMLDPNEISPLKVLQNRIYQQITLPEVHGGGEINAASLVTQFPNGDFVLLIKDQNIEPALIEGYEEAMFPAKVFYANGDTLENVAVNILDGSIYVVDPIDQQLVYGQSFNFGFDGDGAAVDLTLLTDRPAVFTSKLGDTALRQPGTKNIPNITNLMLNILEEQNVERLLQEATISFTQQITGLLSEASPNASKSAIYYDVVSAIPAALAIFNIVGFPLYPIGQLADILVAVVESKLAALDAFYTFIDDNLVDIVANSETTDSLLALRALGVDTSGIDVQAFTKQIEQIVDSAFYSILFSDEIRFFEFRNQSVEHQLTQEAVSAINAGEDYRPTAPELPTIEAVQPVAPTLAEQHADLEQWLETNKKARDELQAERKHNQKSAVLTFVSISALAILGYVYRKPINQMLAL